MVPRSGRIVKYSSSKYQSPARNVKPAGGSPQETSNCGRFVDCMSNKKHFHRCHQTNQTEHKCELYGSLSGIKDTVNEKRGMELIQWYEDYSACITKNAPPLNSLLTENLPRIPIIRGTIILPKESCTNNGWKHFKYT